MKNVKENWSQTQEEKMKDEFINRMENLRVPVINEDQFEHELRKELVRRHFPEKNYKLHFRIATAFAVTFLCILTLMLIKPRIAYDLNSMATNKSKRPPIYDNQDNNYKLVDFTSIENPYLSNRIDKKQFVEGKTYIIRNYVSTDKKGLMIVSEYDPDRMDIVKNGL